MPVELDVNDPQMELAAGTFCEVQWPLHRTYQTLFVSISAVAIGSKLVNKSGEGIVLDILLGIVGAIVGG